MIQVSSVIYVYEEDGKPTSEMSRDVIRLFLVKSHWNETEKVIIHVDGKEWTVLADDLIAAVKNATNRNRF